MNSKKDAYLNALKAKIEEWNVEMDKLAAKVRQADAKSKIEYQRRMDTMREKREELKRRLVEFQNAGEGVWEGLKQGLENSWDILRTTLSKAKAEFEQGYREGRRKGEDKTR